MYCVDAIKIYILRPIRSKLGRIEATSIPYRPIRRKHLTIHRFSTSFRLLHLILSIQTTVESNWHRVQVVSQS